MSQVTCPTVVVEAPTMEPVVAQVRGWTLGMGSQPGVARLYLPDQRSANPTDVLGDWVGVFHDNTLAFYGTIQEVNQSLSGRFDGREITVFDVRHEMARMCVGQHGVGPVTTKGGWPGVGYDLRFNPDGVPNRSATGDPITGVCTFDLNPETAYSWRYVDILLFLFDAYVDPDTCQCLADDIDLPPYDAATPEINLGNCNVCEAIDHVTRMLGGSWTVRFSGTLGDPLYAAYYTPIHADIAATATHAIKVDTGETTTPVSALTAESVVLSQRIVNSYDHVEVHGGPIVVEVTHSDATANPLLEKFTAAIDMPPDCLCYWQVRPDNYAYWNLGEDLDINARPKKWLSNLCTRRSDAAYLTAAELAAQPWIGLDIPARDCIWLSADEGSTWKRVHSGVHVDIERMRLYLRRQGSVYGPTITDTPESWDYEDATDLKVAFTVATRIEYPEVSVTDITDQYLSSMRCRKLVRSDLVSCYRTDSTLPDIESSDPNAFVKVAVSELEPYIDASSDLEAIRDNAWKSRAEVENTAAFYLPFFPLLSLGDGVTMSPLNLGQGTSLRLVSLEYDADRMDLSAVATNNLDGL